MIQDITLPSFGSSVGEATVVEWLVEPGSAVSAGQLIAEIETDKAMAELEAPADGVIESIEVAAGSEGVEVGSVLARLRTAGEAEPPTEETATTPAPPERPESPAPGALASQVQTPPAVHADSERTLASPYARKLARENDLELAGLPGSGPGGRIVSRDLEELASTAAPTDVLAQYGFAPDSYRLEPLSRMRRAIAQGLTQSNRDIPHFSLTVDLDLAAVLAHRAAWPGDKPPSINDYLLWACARALLDVPAANTSWTEDGIAWHAQANVAVAVALEDGLVTPVIHDAGSLTLEAMALASRDAVNKARSGALKTRDLQGATFTVSNLGMMGIRSFNSILSAPQSCILSVGVAEERAVVRGGELAVATQVTVTLTCDHRAVDGAVGARYLQALAARLDAPGD